MRISAELIDRGQKHLNPSVRRGVVSDQFRVVFGEIELARCKGVNIIFEGEHDSKNGGENKRIGGGLNRKIQGAN